MPDRPDELHEQLKPTRASIPSKSTLHRALRKVDATTLARRLACHIEQLAATAPQAGKIKTSTGEPLLGQIEDTSGTHTGSTSRVLHAFLKTVLTRFRPQGWNNLAGAFHHWAACDDQALALIEATSEWL